MTDTYPVSLDMTDPTSDVDDAVAGGSGNGAANGTRDRSDEALLSVLDARIAAGGGKRPTRQEVIDATGVGTSRATRLLGLLNQRHTWPTPTGPTRARPGRTGRRPEGRGQTARTRPAPAPVPVDPAVDTGTTVAALGTTVAQPATAPVPAPQSVPATGRPVAPDRSGWLVAWAGFVFGSVMSVAANVLHTWLPATHQPHGWTPGIAPQIGAAVWPIGLLLSVEVLSRVRWHSGWAWRLARYGGAGTVALGSALISYGHVRDVLTAWGYGHPGADVGPLVLDGLMVISGFALLAISRPTAPRETA